MTSQYSVAPIPLGPEGLTGSKNLATVRPTQLLRAHNITMENGTLQKEPGTSKYTAAAIDSGATIQGGWDWWPSVGVQRSVILTSNGKLLKDSGAGTYPTTLATGLSVANVVPVFVEAGKEAAANNRKLFVFTGSNQVRVLSADGATMAAIATPPADWAAGAFPKTGCVHEGRLWGFMGHFAYYSTTSNHEDFTGATSGQLFIYPGEGEDIVASFVFGPYIVVLKQPAGIYLIDTTATSTTNWRVNRITRQIGIAGPLAYAVMDGDGVVVDISGEYFALSAITELNDIRPRSLTQDAEMSPFLRENTNPASYGKIVGLYYPGKRQGWFATAGGGSTVNNGRVKLDVNRPGPVRFSFSDFVTCESMWLRKDANNVPRPVGGDNAGFVRLLDQTALTHDGGGYQGDFQTPHTDLAYIDPVLATKRKNGHALELVFEPQGEWDLNLGVLWDGNLEDTYAFSMRGAGGAILGTTTTLDDPGHFVLGGDQVVTAKRRITGGGRRISLTGSNSGSGQGFSVAAAYLHYLPGDERE